MAWNENKDPEGNRMLSLENGTMDIHLDDEENAVLVNNNTNGVITWNSPGVTHVNLPLDNLSMIINTSAGIITFVSNTDKDSDDKKEENDKYMIIEIEDLIGIILKNGYTYEEMMKALEKEKEKENEEES